MTAPRLMSDAELDAILARLDRYRAKKAAKEQERADRDAAYAAWRSNAPVTVHAKGGRFGQDRWAS